jgi:hypothetical protein
MTIRRQYNLPNCTLVLDGIGDGNMNTGFADGKPLMSSLMNAECHFADRDRPLSGGGEFFRSLTTSVNNYAQELLSGIPHPPPPKDSGLVKISPSTRPHFHRISALETSNTDILPTGDLSSAVAMSDRRTEWEISTVQLFDLVEAIDLFLADNNTLPDIQVPISPSPASFNRPIVKQAAPAGLGIIGLAATALACYTIPAPLKVEEPKVLDLPPAAPTALPNPGGAPPLLPPTQQRSAPAVPQVPAKSAPPATPRK